MHSAVLIVIILTNLSGIYSCLKIDKHLAGIAPVCSKESFTGVQKCAKSAMYALAGTILVCVYTLVKRHVMVTV